MRPRFSLPQPRPSVGDDLLRHASRLKLEVWRADDDGSCVAAEFNIVGTFYADDDNPQQSREFVTFLRSLLGEFSKPRPEAKGGAE